MAELGKVDWQRYDEQDEATHPTSGYGLLIITLKNGKVSVLPHCYFGMRRDRFYEVRSVIGYEAITKLEHKVAEYDDVACAYLDVPSWWHAKEKEE